MRALLILFSLHALASTPLLEKIRSYTTRLHGPPTTKAQWLALGPQAESLILEEYQTSESLLQRSNLLRALAHFSSIQGLKLLESEAEGGATKILQLSAIEALGERGAEVNRFLKHPDPHIRLQAARSLRRQGHHGAVQRFQEHEPSGWVLKRLTGRPVTLTESEKSQTLWKTEFAGKWVGFWMPGPLGRTARMVLQEKRGTLYLTTARGVVELPIEIRGGERDRIHGVIQKAGRMPNRTLGANRDEVIFSAEKKPFRRPTLQLDIPQWSAVVILRQ